MPALLLPPSRALLLVLVAVCICDCACLASSEGHADLKESGERKSVGYCLDENKIDEVDDATIHLPPWEGSLPPAVMQRAIAHMGDLIRFDRLLHKVLVQRKPITVVILGSSITLRAGREGPQMKVLNLDAMSVKRLFVHEQKGWLSVALDWLVKAFPPQTNFSWQNTTDLEQRHFDMSYEFNRDAQYWLINLGVGAVGPQPWAMCLGKTFFQLLPKEVDLVVLEWAVVGTDPKITRSLDEVLQALLRKWKDPPAFLMINFFFWCRGDFGCHGTQMDEKTGDMTQISIKKQKQLNWDNIGVFSFNPPSGDNFKGQVVEDEFALLAQYYGMPVLSVRDAFFALAADEEPGYALSDIIREGDAGMHPSMEQARTRYRDIIIHFFRQAIGGFSARERERKHEGQREEAIRRALLNIPPPLYQRLYPHEYGQSKVQLAACFSFDNWLGTPPQIRHSHGFNQTNDPDSKVPKPGYCTWQAGSTVEFVIDTSTSTKDLHLASPTTAKAFVDIRYLTSHQRMGRAQVECVEGCACNPTVLDGHIQENWSVPAETRIEVSQAKNCVLKVTTILGGGGSKFKIFSLSVSFQQE